MERLTVASPCTASWQDMRGNEQVRHCSQCRGIGGGVYVEIGATVGTTKTLIFGNFASTSNDNLYGVLS
jgi:hypothetical protein